MAKRGLVRNDNNSIRNIVDVGVSCFNQMFSLHLRQSSWIRAPTRPYDNEKGKICRKVRSSPHSARAAGMRRRPAGKPTENIQ